jgi:hypothetical protein
MKGAGCLLCAPPQHKEQGRVSREHIEERRSKAMWVGRTTVAVIGLTIALALVLGGATMALAAVPGDPFRRG